MHSCTYPPVGEFLCSSCNTRSCTYHKQSFPSPLSTQREQYLYKKTRIIYISMQSLQYTQLHISHTIISPLSTQREQYLYKNNIYLLHIIEHIQSKEEDGCFSLWERDAVCKKDIRDKVWINTLQWSLYLCIYLFVSLALHVPLTSDKT